MRETQGGLRLGRSRSWVIAELLVLLAALVILIAGVETIVVGLARRGDPYDGGLEVVVGVFFIAGSIPLFLLGLLTRRHSRAVGWILMGFGAPIFVLSAATGWGLPALAVLAAPPLAGLLLLRESRRN